jgi:hypothetical protein
VPVTRFSLPGARHNWPDTGPGARARKRADVPSPDSRQALLAERFGQRVFELVDGGGEPDRAFAGGEQVGLQGGSGDGRSGGFADGGHAGFDGVDLAEQVALTVEEVAVDAVRAMADMLISVPSAAALSSAGGHPLATACRVGLAAFGHGCSTRGLWAGHADALAVGAADWSWPPDGSNAAIYRSASASAADRVSCPRWLRPDAVRSGRGVACRFAVSGGGRSRSVACGLAEASA